MFELLESRIIGEDLYKVFKIEKDDKVEKIGLKIRPEWDNRLMGITVYYKSGRVTSFSGSLSNHKMPIKYRNYVKQIIKNIKF